MQTPRDAVIEGDANSRFRLLPLLLGPLALVSAIVWLGAQGPVGAAIGGVCTVVFAFGAIASWKHARPRALHTHIGLGLGILALFPVVFLLINLIADR